MEDKRIEWIDIAKFIGIVFVIFGHMESFSESQDSDSLYSYIKMFIFTFHMPLFFFLSGFVSKKKKIKQTLGSGIRQLIIPYIAYVMFMNIYYLIISVVRNNFSVNKSLVRPMLGLIMGYSCSFADMLNGPCWFLLSLFVCKVIYSILAKNKIILGLEVLILLVMTIFIYIVRLELPFSISPAFLGIWYFLLGVIMRTIVGTQCIALLQERFRFIRLTCGIVGLLLLILVYYCTRFVGIVDIQHLLLGNEFVFVVVSLLGICGICLISYSIKNIPDFIKLLSENTLIILGTHIFFISIIKTGIVFDYNSDCSFYKFCIDKNKGNL